MDGETITTTCGDDQALADATHDLVFSSTTYRNRVSGDPAFSSGAVEAAELLTTTDIYSNFGERRVLTFNVIFSGDNPSVVNAIKQFLESTSDVTQNNPGVKNVSMNKYRHVILPQLATDALGANDSTKKRWWGIAAIHGNVNGWQAYLGEWEASHLNVMPSSGNNGENVHNDNWTYGTRAGYGIVTLNGKGIIFSCPVS